MIILLILCLLNSLFVFGPIVFGIIKLVQYFKKKEKERRDAYENGAYFQITHIPYRKRQYDSGSMGEYLIYEKIKYRENCGAKFLFNLYIPKKDGTTAEIDVIMIDARGIFVFESKNYSGWIFGNEKSKQWCQCLRSGWYNSHKEHFYNPIMQNESHVNVLYSYFKQFKIDKSKIPMYNIVVFSDRCDFKNNIGRNQHVTHRYNLNNRIDEFCKPGVQHLNETQINWIYKKLYPFSQAHGEIREQHVRNIKQYQQP